MMQPEVTIYTTPTCTYCAAAKRWFKEHGVTYTEHDVTRDPVRAAELQRLTGQTAVPVIRVGGQVMVGFDPLQLARLIPANPDPADGGAASPAGPRLSLGMAAQSLTAERAAELGLPAAFGVVVGPVRAGGPAEAAGIQEGDVLTGLGSYTLQDLSQLQRVVSLKQPGDSLALKVWRDGAELELTLHFPAPEVATAPSTPASASPPEQQPLET
ncbi:MAG: Uxx-star family glutaredoxin-like (seleno)protein [Candidatus Dormibacteria bacterium]